MRPDPLETTTAAAAAAAGGLVCCRCECPTFKTQFLPWPNVHALSLRSWRGDRRDQKISASVRRLLPGIFGHSFFFSFSPQKKIVRPFVRPFEGFARGVRHKGLMGQPQREPPTRRPKSHLSLLQPKVRTARILLNVLVVRALSYRLLLLEQVPFQAPRRQGRSGQLSLKQIVRTHVCVVRLIIIIILVLFDSFVALGCGAPRHISRPVRVHV